MHQRVTNRANQQHYYAKYHRMEPIDTGHSRNNPDTRMMNEAKQASTKTTPRSPLLEPATSSYSAAAAASSAVARQQQRGRNWSTHSGDSLNDDLASIEAVFSDADWSSKREPRGDKNQNKLLIEPQRLGAFPTSLPTFAPTTTAAVDSGRHLSSTSNFSNGSPSPHPRLRIYIEENDTDGGESMAASVYENCSGPYQSQNLDEISNDSFYSASSSKPNLIMEPPQKPTRLHTGVTFMDPLTSTDSAPGNLSVPSPSYASIRRKSGTVAGSAPTLSPDGSVQYTVNGARRLSARGRSRSPTPRPSVIDGAAGSPTEGAAGASTPDEPEKKEAKGHSGPSSRRTVLMIAGLFVVGLILILSGIIVLTVEQHTAFRVAGCSFLGLGITFFIICLFLQRKNVKKLVNQLENDLYFLNVTDNKIWNMIFHFDEQLHW